MSGPTGPTGPTGPRGMTGPSGPAGQNVPAFDTLITSGTLETVGANSTNELYIFQNVITNNSNVTGHYRVIISDTGTSSCGESTSYLNSIFVIFPTTNGSVLYSKSDLSATGLSLAVYPLTTDIVITFTATAASKYLYMIFKENIVL
jgi:hypothetical protein